MHRCCQTKTIWHVQEWLVPIRAVVDNQWHTPKAPGSKTMQTLTLKLSDVQVQPAFGHVPLIHTATQMVKDSRASAGTADASVSDQQPIPMQPPEAEAELTMSQATASALSATADALLTTPLSVASVANSLPLSLTSATASIAAASAASAVGAASVAAASVASVAAVSLASVAAARAVMDNAPFRPTCMHVTADIESLAVALVDDRYGHPIEVLAVRLQVCFRTHS